MPHLRKKYKLPPDVVVKKKDGKFLFFNTSVPAWIVTNSNGATALNLCNGKRTLEEIIRKVSKLAGRNIAKELTEFFKEIDSQSNLLLSPEREIPVHQPYNLHIVHLHLTNRCNLKCIYCYADERSEAKPLLQLADYRKLIDSTKNLSSNAEFVLTGGEPLLTSYALDVATYAKQTGNKVHILTNGALINEDNARQISEVTDLIKISIDGSNPELHDFHRGEGSFFKAMKGIDLLLQQNAPLQISMTVTKKNINDVESMLNKFGSLLSFAPLFKAGRAKTHRDLSITGKEYYKALSSVNGVNPLSCLCSSLDRAKKKRIMKCAIGDAEISISDAGDVYPCHLLHLPQFFAGNVKEESLESIYHTSGRLQECRNLIVLETKGCNKCDIRFICGGACRARAFFETGRINVSDDFCVYEKLAFTNGLFDLHELV